MSGLIQEKKGTKIEICKQQKEVLKDDGAKEETALIVPPDGGWGWVVVVAAFVCTFLVDGILYSGGLLLKPIQTEFNASEKDVASVYSLLCGFYLIAGPFASVLTNNYSFTKVTIMGSFISITGFVLSYFVPNIGCLYVTYGILGGIGFCLINMSAVVVIGFYFEKYRGLATGLALCGSGVGTFVLAPFTDRVVELYGWRVTMLYYGGFMCLTILCGFVFRPIKPILLEIYEKNDDTENVLCDESIPIDKDSFKISQIPPDINCNQSHKDMKLFRENLQRKRRCSEGQGILHKDFFESKNSRLNTIRDEENIAPLLSSSLKSIPQEGKMFRRSSEVVLTAFNRDDMHYSGSLKRLSEYASRSSLAYHLSVTHCETKEINETEKSNCVLAFFKNTFQSLFDVSLFQSATFILLAVSGFLTLMGLFTPYMFVAKRAEEHGLDKTASSLLVSTIGIANTVGRFACGLLTTVPQISSLKFTNIVLTIGGIATMASGLCYHPVYQFAFCVIFGFSGACFVSLRSILAVEYVGLNKLTNCFGLFLLFQGFGALIGSPIAGALKDLTRDYDAAFYVAGFFILMSAVICYPVQCIYKWEKSKKESTP